MTGRPGSEGATGSDGSDRTAGRVGSDPTTGAVGMSEVSGLDDGGGGGSGSMSTMGTAGVGVALWTHGVGCEVRRTTGVNVGFDGGDPAGAEGRVTRTVRHFLHGTPLSGGAVLLAYRASQLGHRRWNIRAFGAGQGQ